MKISAIILARSGSKGIPNKNIIDFCGKPLMAWTIEHCFEGGVDEVYVSSDSEEILAVGKRYGARCILRPDKISVDTATSESGWIHALGLIEKEIGIVDWVLAPQATSPLRTAEDIRNGLKIANSDQYDSLFSCSIAGDLFYWEKRNGIFESSNYDWKNRQRKQDFQAQYIENGSFYLFKPEIIRKYKNRFGGRIGIVEMNFWQMFEIDYPEDLRICEALMEEFILKRSKDE